MKRKLVSVLLCAGLTFGLAACGSTSTSQSTDTAAATESSQTTTTESTASGDAVTIQVFTNLPDRTSGQGMIEQMLFDQYMKENPNVDIQVEALDDESYKTKFKAYASGSQMPDLVSVWGQPSFLSEVIDAGLLAELNGDDYADYGFLEGSLDGFSRDGKLYGLARNTDVMGFYYNKQIFTDLGLEIPTSYEELMADAAKIKEAGYIPIAMDGSDKWPVSIYINDLYQKVAGSSTHDEVSTAVESGDYSNASWTKATDLTLEAVNSGAFQSGFETTDYGTALNLFTNGQAAMYYMGSWEMSMATNEDLDEGIRTNIGAFSMPVVDGGNGKVTDICAWNGGGYAVTANSKVKEETVKLLNYMFLPDNWTKLAWENGVCMSAQNFSAYLTGNETSLQNEWVDIVNNSSSISGVTFNDLGTNEFKTVSEDASVELAIGSLDPEEFFTTLSGAMK